MSCRILFVELSTVVGGSVLSLFELARGLAAAGGYEPVVVLRAAHPATGLFEGAGIRTVHLGEARHVTRPAAAGQPGHPWADWATAFGQLARQEVPTALDLRRILASEQVDLVHHNINLPRDRVNVVAVAAAGVPQVCHVRNLSHLSALDRLVSRLPGCCVYVSRAVERHALGQGAAPRRRRVVYNPVDVDGVGRGDGARVRAELGLDPGCPVISNIGRLEPWKGQDVFLRSLPEVLRHHDVKVLVVGEVTPRAGAVDYERRLRALVDELRLGNHVLLTGFRNDIPDVLAASDVVVHSARTPEPFGRVVVEAMASGTPVIATGAGGVPEVMTDGEDGLLVPGDDHGALASAIVRVLDDPAEADRMGAAGRRTADRFTVERHVAAMAEVYAELTGGADLAPRDRGTERRVRVGAGGARAVGDDEGGGPVPQISGEVRRRIGMSPVARLLVENGRPEGADPQDLQALYGIVGRAASRSMSPLLHNAGYRALGLPALYLPFETSRFASFWRHLVNPGPGSAEALVGGLTITAPYKEAALQAADTTTLAAERAGAANILLRKDGGWMADTTDTSGVLGALRHAGVDPAGRTAAVVGCGGTGRAAALALTAQGVGVTLVNRGPERARLAARLLGLAVTPLATFDPAPYDLVVHATPVHDHCPFAVDRLGPGSVVLDMVYRREPTALAVAARELGLPTVDGWDVLAYEVGEQFRLMTGHRLPDGVVTPYLHSDALEHPFR